MYPMMRFCLIVALVGSSYAESFTFCKMSDPDADKCLAKSIETALHLLKSDIPEYGLKSVDPYPVDKITLDAGSGPVQLVQYYTNVELLGFTDISVSKAHLKTSTDFGGLSDPERPFVFTHFVSGSRFAFDDKTKILSIEATFPKITQQGDYIVDGKILALPVTGQGKSMLILENMKAIVSMHFEEVQKNGQTYYKIKKFPLDLTPARMRMSFENLFNGNKLLGENINKLINDEWQALYNDVKPSVVKNYEGIFIRYAQVFFDKVPAEKIFLK